jgi:endonuclease YncB( thermonuclease family)
MLRHLSLITLVSAVALAGGKKPGGTIVLNGEETSIRWSDGDSFHIKSGKYDGKGTRLAGYNTLEVFGPVHRWGDWTAAELYDIAKNSATLAASQVWECTTDGKQDGYHRLLITCPALAEEMIRQGHALAYAVEGTKPEPKLLAAQKEAQAAKRGIWKKGVVKGVVTSVHSADEDGDEEGAGYNRVVDTRSGEALARSHKNTYKTCEEVCETTDGDVSCMIYVPFEHRYRNKPKCLK